MTRPCKDSFKLSDQSINKFNNRDAFFMITHLNKLFSKLAHLSDKIITLLCVLLINTSINAEEFTKPNIVWVTSEDLSA